MSCSLTSENQAAAAEFVDYKLVKTRSVAQIILEIDIAQVDEVVRLLGGTPQPERSQWVALAPLKGSYGPSEVRMADDVTRRSWKTLTPTEQAGIRCNDHAFQEFLAERAKLPEGTYSNPADAAAFVRGHCGVPSRADLAHNPYAARAWKALDSAFIRWLHEPATAEERHKVPA